MMLKYVSMDNSPPLCIETTYLAVLRQNPGDHQTLSNSRHVGLYVTILPIFYMATVIFLYFV